MSETGVLLVVGTVAMVLAVNYWGTQLRGELRSLRQQLEDGTDTVRDLEADAHNRMCFPHLYPELQTDLRARYREIQHQRQNSTYLPPWFVAMKRWEGNSAATEAYRSLWDWIEAYRGRCPSETVLNAAEIEFLWQLRLSTTMLGFEKFDDSSRVDHVYIKSLEDHLAKDLARFGRKA